MLPGVFRLRLPLPWPGVPHGNAWAVAAGDGIVLFDTGMHAARLAGAPRAGAGDVRPALEDVRLVVCTHAHSDHYGQAATIVERAGCELWMHPNYEHMSPSAEDPDAALERRLEVARQSGVPEEPLRRYAAERARDRESGIAAVDRARPRAAARRRRSTPTSAPGPCTRRPATPPRTSASSSPSGAC